MSTKPLRPTSSSHPVSVTDTHSFDSSTSIIHHVLGHVSLGNWTGSCFPLPGSLVSQCYQLISRLVLDYLGPLFRYFGGK